MSSYISDDFCSSELFWTSVDRATGAVALVTSDLQGSSQRVVLPSSLRSRRDSSCNCSANQNISPVFLLDTRSGRQNTIYIVMADSGAIVRTDRHGCRCSVLIDRTRVTGFGKSQH